MALVLEDEGILIATRDKMVYAFGHNKDKLLGIGCTSMTLQPKEVEVLCGKNIIKFVFWEKGPRIIALTKEGEVYSWGYNEEKLKQALNSYDDHVRKGLTIPTQMRLLRKKHIIDIKCSISHCLALTDDGEVYIWGYSVISVLNNNIDPETYFSTDIKQVHFNGKKIVCIACGSFFSMAVSNEGKLYSWGHYQIDCVLGIDITPPECNPDISNTYQVTRLSNKIIVICGCKHTIALTDEGEIYTWGSNFFGQLGFDQEVLMKSMYPVLLDMPKMKKILDIAIGQRYERNFVLCNDGCIYMWGGKPRAWSYFNTLYQPTITPFSNMHEALMFYDLPLMIFADDLKYMDEELDILECWETLFDDPSTSDLTIQIEGQSIHVHKAILKTRSSYFRTMFQDDSKENNESVIQHSQYSYIVYKAFLKYLYTEVIDLSREKLLELLDLAIVYCESKLERYCIQEIKRGITIQNVALLRSTAEKYNKEDLINFCLHFESGNS